MLVFLAMTAFAWDPADTITTSADGQVVIAGRPSRARHTHGGAAARLGHARFTVTNAGSEPVTIAVTGVTHLRGHDCDAPPADRVSTPELAEVQVGETVVEGTTVVIEPGPPVPVEVRFAPVEGYYTYCNRFAFEVAFALGDEPLVAIAETNVMRMQPLRRDE